MTDCDCTYTAADIDTLVNDLQASWAEVAELKRKLAKAVASLETLEDASRFFGSDTQTDREGLRYAHETTRRLCRATLAEIEGVKP